MAEYDKGRLYWIKLTDRMMTSDTVDFLMGQKNGANLVVLYQMLCLKTINQNGVLARELGELTVKYDADKIQRDCKWFSLSTVKSALKIFKEIGLLYENEDGFLAISEFDSLIGSQTYGAVKKEKQKNGRKNSTPKVENRVENFPPQNAKKVENFPLEKEKDKEIKIKEKERKEKDDFSTPPPLVKAEQVVDLYNTICLSLNPVQTLTQRRREAVDKVLHTSSLEQIEKLFRQAEATPFLKGDNRRRWKADFDWLINEDNMVKVFEGKYNDDEPDNTLGTPGTYVLDDFFRAAVEKERHGVMKA